MNNLRQLRKASGLTMKQLGKIVGMSESTISLYERGIHEPDIETMGKLADALHTSVDELIGREETDTKKEPATVGGLDDRLVEMLVSLSPDQVQRVQDFVAGMKASETT